MNGDIALIEPVKYLSRTPKIGIFFCTELEIILRPDKCCAVALHDCTNGASERFYMSSSLGAFCI